MVAKLKNPKVTISKRVRRTAALAVAVIAVIVIFLSASFAAVTLGYAKRSLPFVKIGAIELGNLPSKELEQTLAQLQPEPIEISAEKITVTLAPQDIDFSYDAAKTAIDLISISEPQRLLSFEPLKKRHLVFNYNDQKLDQFIDNLAKKIDVPAKNASLEFKKKVLQVNKEISSGKTLDKSLLKQAIISQIGQYNFSNISAIIKMQDPEITPEMIENSLGEVNAFLERGLTLKVIDEEIKIEKQLILTFIDSKPNGAKIKLDPDKESIAAYIKTLAKQKNQIVKDANLKMVDGKVEVFQASQEGRKINQEKTVDLIIKALKSDSRVVEVPVEITSPNVSTASVNDLGINQIIGTATTNFKGSPDNRKHNISNGAARLNGILVGPGQVFSTIDALGNPDEASGYLPELVIKENRTVPEFGGGLCQVSTTLFRAALNAGLPIVERQNHSWRISYYEPPVGLDATVYFPKPDFKFKNDTPGWVLIQSKIDGTLITFEFFGTSDGRRSEVTNKTLSTTKAPAPVYAETDTLTRGTTKQTEKPHPGGRAVATYKVFDKEGNLINDQTFTSSYKAVPARFLVGTAEPAPSPAPDPAPSETPAAQTPSPEPQPAQSGTVAGEQTQQ